MRPDILFIHGAFTRAERWQPWIRFFTAAGHRCIAPSLPAHDPPDRDAIARLTFADYVDAMEAVHATCERPPIVIGHSMGGLIAQHLAARTECAALVLVSSTPPWRTPGTRHAARYLLPYLLPVMTGRPIRANPKAALTLVLHDLPAEEQQQFVPIFALESGKAYRTVVFGRARIPPGAVKCPVLCVNGLADRMLAPSVGGRLAKFYDADYLPVPGHGHSLVADSLVGTVATAVRDWLDRQDFAEPADASFRRVAVV